MESLVSFAIGGLLGIALDTKLSAQVTIATLCPILALMGAWGCQVTRFLWAHSRQDSHHLWDAFALPALGSVLPFFTPLHYCTPKASTLHEPQQHAWTTHHEGQQEGGGSSPPSLQTCTPLPSHPNCPRQYGNMEGWANATLPHMPLTCSPQPWPTPKVALVVRGKSYYGHHLGSHPHKGSIIPPCPPTSLPTLPLSPQTNAWLLPCCPCLPKHTMRAR